MATFKCSNLKHICMILFSFLLCSSCGSSLKTVDVGTVNNFDSRSGKEEKIAMIIALHDFYGFIYPHLTLHFKNSGGNPFQAFSLAKSLIEEKHVKVLMGYRTWEVAAVTIGFINSSRIPMLSLAGEIPPWASQQWPFFISAARSQIAQMKAVIAIIHSWKWRRVTIIYEDTGSASDGIIPELINSIKDAGIVIEKLARLSPWSAFSDKNYIRQELDKLKAKQSRVFIVHTSVKLGSTIFIQANKMGMMKNDSVWITTTAITNELESLDAATNAAMKGVLGVQSYFSTGNRYEDFKTKFIILFKAMYPKEAYTEPGYYALQAYDALWALALAKNSSTMSSESFVENILDSNFEGLNGVFKYIRGRLIPQKVFRIVNFYEKGNREIGYWSEGLGFSVNIGKGSKFEKYLSTIGQVIWPGPGGPAWVPRGSTIPTDANPLLVGVPMNPAFKDFVKVDCNGSSCTNPKVTGFSVDVFEATLARLPYNVSYKFVAYNGTYDSMIQEVQNETFQAVIGDTSILANRCRYVQFTPPYSEPGLQAVIYVKNNNTRKAWWIFRRPFTRSMWMYTGLINIYNGFVVWLIERRHNPAFRGSIWNQIGTLIHLTFTTLFSLQGGSLHSNMSRMTMVVWLFVALVVTSSYTASLSSLLTVDNLRMTLDIDKLKQDKVKVGCNGNSFVGSYLQTVGFRKENILKVFKSEEYPQLLKNGTIKAAFLITPHVKIFMASHCSGYKTVEPTYKIGGFGFVFAKGHPLLPDVSQAVLNISESEELKALERKMLSKYQCSEPKSEDEKGSLKPDDFQGVFIITFATSTLALFSFCVSRYFWGATEPHVAVNNC